MMRALLLLRTVRLVIIREIMRVGLSELRSRHVHVTHLGSLFRYDSDKPRSFVPITGIATDSDGLVARLKASIVVVGHVVDAIVLVVRR